MRFPDHADLEIHVMGLDDRAVSPHGLLEAATAGIYAVGFVDLAGHELDGLVDASVTQDDHGRSYLLVDATAPNPDELIRREVRNHVQLRRGQATSRGPRHLRAV